MKNENHVIGESIDQDKFLEQIMKRKLETIMELPTQDQIFDNVSFKLGAFYKRFWRNKFKGIKQNTRKPGQIIMMAQGMRQVTRMDDRLIKICAYARQLKKHQYQNYNIWKKFIWLDLQENDRIMMEKYVDLLTPPSIQANQQKQQYQKREKQEMQKAYQSMKRGMIFVQILQKIWTIRKYRSSSKLDDVKRYQDLTSQMLQKIILSHPNIDKIYLQKIFGKQEWKQLKDLKLWNSLEQKKQ